jgi:hypothetical protein
MGKATQKFAVGSCVAYYFDRQRVGQVLGQGPVNATVKWLDTSETEHVPARHLVEASSEACLPRFEGWEAAGAYLRGQSEDTVDVMLSIDGKPHTRWTLCKDGQAVAGGIDFVRAE